MIMQYERLKLLEQDGLLTKIQLEAIAAMLDAFQEQMELRACHESIKNHALTLSSAVKEFLKLEPPTL